MMSEKIKQGLSWIVLLFLLCAGIWQISYGEKDFGVGLIAGAVGVSVVRMMKKKKIKDLQDQGLNPYDERVYTISYRASYTALRTIILLSAAYVLIGSILGPEITVNPYNFIGGWMGLMVLVYIIAYYRYNRKM